MATFRTNTDTLELSSSELVVDVHTPSPRVARGTRAPSFELSALEGAPERFGPYLVYDELGVGGMASVHRAESHGISGFRKPVALKRMLGHVASDPASVRAFLEEARLASRLHHENISQAYDFGTIDGTYYIAMELVPGPTLKQIIIQCTSAAGAIPVPIAIEILIQLCEALDYAHTLTDDGRPLGIIHRDVSPSNIIVSGSGVVKLIDFGIAKAEMRGERTQTGVIKGKLGYLAPEYLAGRLDARADLFGLGVVAHELLTGRRLFGGTNDFEICNAVRERPIQPPSRNNPQISAVLDDIILTALQRDPDRRWQSARAMAVALRGVSRELGAGVSNRQIRDWAEWAFEQDARASIEIIQLVENLEEQLAEPSGVVVEPPRPQGAATVYAKPRPSAQYPVLRPHPVALLAPWLILLALLALAGAGVYRSYVAPDREAIFDDVKPSS